MRCPMTLSPAALSTMAGKALRDVSTWCEDWQMRHAEWAAVLEYERSDTCKSREEADWLSWVHCKTWREEGVGP